MKYPPFFDRVESIRLYDPLAEFLGSFEQGEIEIHYVDIAKLAGHSCPTVAGAYLITQEALKALYPDSLPVRGEIKVSFKEQPHEGVAGVIAHIVSNITGATEKSGFKGLNGKFSRVDLMAFGQDLNASAQFERTDTHRRVQITYNPQGVPADPNMQPLMQKSLQAIATEQEQKRFGQLWQKRVEEILCNSKSYPDLIRIELQ